MQRKNDQLCSENFHLNQEILNFNEIKKDSAAEVSQKQNIINDLAKEIDSWHFKSTEIERKYLLQLHNFQNTLKSYQQQVIDLTNQLHNARKAPQDLLSPASPMNLNGLSTDERQNLSLINQTAGKEPVSENKIDEIQPELIKNDEKIKENDDRNENDHDKYRDQVAIVTNGFLNEKKSIIADYEKIVSDLRVLNAADYTDDMSLVVAKNIESKLAGFFDAKKRQDLEMIFLQVF